MSESTRVEKRRSLASTSASIALCALLAGCNAAGSASPTAGQGQQPAQPPTPPPSQTVATQAVPTLGTSATFAPTAQVAAPTAPPAASPTAAPVANVPVTNKPGSAAAPEKPVVQAGSTTGSLGAPGGKFDAMSIARVVQAAAPGVVQITNEQEKLQNTQTVLVPAGVGTGVIMDPQGYIMTNNHVVEGAQKLQVSLVDGRTFPAKLVGADPRTDLAVVKIDAPDLRVLPLGDSSKLQVGQWVVAIGNALALEGGPTVTHGVVSAVGRTVQEPGSTPGQTGPYLFDAIQTNAPINPGNSGGPLFDLSGTVIGINTLVAGEAEPGVASHGVGFSIAINTAKRIADSIIKTGRAVHPFIGVNTQQNSASLAKRYDLPQVNGVVIASVVANAPAAKAGLAPKDVITAIDGQELVDESTLPRILDQHNPGDTITLAIVRGSEKRTVKLTLGEAPTR